MYYWNFIQTNWHKIIVVIMVLAQLWKFFFNYIRPAIKEKNTQPISINLPPEGCQIIIKPLD